MYLSHKFDSVLIVEWLNAYDPKTGTALAASIEAPCRHRRIRLDHLVVHSAEELLTLLRSLPAKCRALGSSPILHLETHGTPTGIGAIASDQIPWHSLVAPLQTLNRTTRMNLLVTMAACHGFNLVATLKYMEPAPVWGLIGPDEMVLPSDVERSFSAFFRTLLSELDLSVALSELRAQDASNPAGWHIEFAEVFLSRAFAEFLRGLTMEQLRLREDRTIANGAKRGILGDPDRIAKLREFMSNHEELFRLSKERVLMLDAFPENLDRFPISFSDVLRIHDIDPATLPRLI